MNCPVVHHRRIRTSNLLERAFVEQRRRSRTIPGFFDERSCLKLVFVTLSQASERWKKVRMSEIECRQLDHLRRELRLEKAQLTKAEPVKAPARAHSRRHFYRTNRT